MKRPYILITTSNADSDHLSPIIGDAQVLYSDRATATAIVRAGGLPVYIPATEGITETELEGYLKIADGVLLTGADTNTNPLYYGESPTHIKGRVDDKRDRVDIELIKMAYGKGLPILGICKGMQVANVALGGTLYQNISSQHPGCISHDIKKADRSDFTHEARLMKGSLLKKIFRTNTMQVNGGHQQAVKQLASCLKSVAIAEDGIVEAYEGKGTSFLMGVQFHAELRVFDDQYMKIFKKFIQAAK